MKLKEVTLCTIGACVLVLTGASHSLASAQTAAAGSSAALQRWNTASEISFTGTIHEVVPEHTSGAPAGVNLLMDDTQTFQYASLGTQLSSSVKNQLTPGQAVALKGIIRSIDGQSVLFVRQLTIGQQTTQIRNTHGMLSPHVETSAYQGNRPRSKNAVAGGAQ